jgi:predicted nucleotidyltransferase
MRVQHRRNDAATAVNRAELLEVLGEAADSVELLVLFGSLARADGSASARRPAPRDIDLGVLYGEDATVRVWWQVEAGLRRFFADRPLDLVDLRSAPPLLRFEVARDGHLLYERRPYQWADFRARAMVDWWDWAPYQRRMDRGAIRRLREASGGPP